MSPAITISPMSLQAPNFQNQILEISKKLEYEAGTIYAGSPASLGFGVGGQSYSNFPASTVGFLIATSQEQKRVPKSE